MLSHLVSEGQQMHSTSCFYISNLTVQVILITGVKLYTQEFAWKETLLFHNETCQGSA